MIVSTAKKVLRIEAAAIRDLIPRLDENFVKAVEMIYSSKGRVILTGMGKSGIICRKIAGTLASTGTPALFLHPAEAVHGDMGMMVKGDIVIAISYGGETEEILKLLLTIKRLGLKLISMTGNPKSTLAHNSEVHLDVSIKKEACPMGLVPTASTTAALAMGDAIAIALLEKRGFREKDFAELHPGGKLGKKLMRVEDLMHAGKRIPRVKPDTPMRDVIYEMTNKGLGMTTVVDGNTSLLGIITDGDLRRLLDRENRGILDKTAGQCMTPRPITIDRDELATKALNIMEERKITSLIVVDEKGRVEGVLHIHDLWRTEMF